jgi:hypothetical protein
LNLEKRKGLPKKGQGFFLLAQDDEHHDYTVDSD